jgi:hypothetical protein
MRLRLSSSEYVAKPYELLVLAAILQAKRDLQGRDFLKAFDAFAWLSFGEGETLAELAGVRFEFEDVVSWILED